MKILWITNTLFPATCIRLGIKTPNTGGWMFSLAYELIKKNEIVLAVATVYDGDDLKCFENGKVSYYLLPFKKNNTLYDASLEDYWLRVVREYCPDLIHIHGTEYAHGLACMRTCPDQRYVISIQGLVGVYSEYYYAGIDAIDIIKNITFRDIIRMKTIFHGKRAFEKSGIIEREYIKRSKYIIGRTCWDYAHVRSINREIQYRFNNEILRSSFYDSEKWSINRKESFSIFSSQSIYPIKGLHQILKALSNLKLFYPNIQLRVAGPDITKYGNCIERIKISGYGAYIRSLMKDLKISHLVTFTGPLDEEQMVQEYKKAHVFVCPSSIENSPNSIGEAQIIGTPCVASYVGGIPDMVEDEESGLLYRFDDYIMLAHQIQRIFESDELAMKLSMGGCSSALKRHNRDENTVCLLNIYSGIINHD